MYVIPQGGKISNGKLNLNLSKFGYEPAPITPGFCRHQTYPLQLSLLLDEFGVKYERQAGIIHILDTLKTIYKISDDWDGKLYYGINL